MNTEELDLINRDPNDVNNHVKVAFEEVLAEPDAAHSFDCVWKLSFICFECFKSCTYKMLTCCFGICIAAEWGYYFGYTAFYHVWYITPILKIMEINCSVFQKIYGMCVHCCCDPCFEAFSNCFNPFRKD